MNEHLAALESAISDVGRWTWWTGNLPATFQVEFNGTQLWNPPASEGKPPSGQIALCFRKPRLAYFLTLSDSVPGDWPDQLQRDELGAFRVDHEAFTLSSAELCGRIAAKAKSIRALVGEPGKTPLPAAGEALLGFEAGPVGVVVAAESLAVFNHHGVMDQQAVLESSRRWWAYWREYWQRMDTPNPLPHDYACEVTIPAAPDAEPDAAANGGRNSGSA